MKRKILMLALLTAVFALLLCVGAGAVDEYDLWVNGVQVTSDNAADVLGSADEGATVKYDAATNTLTLDGAELDTAYRGSSGHAGVIYGEYLGTLTINVVGDSSIVASGPGDTAGIYLGIYREDSDPRESSVILTGNATLDITVNQTGSAVRARNDITVQQLTLNMYLTDSSAISSAIDATESVTIKDNAKITIDSKAEVAAIFSNYEKIEIRDAVVNITALSEYANSIYSDKGDIIISGNANVTANSYYGISGNDIQISGNAVVDSTSTVDSAFWVPTGKMTITDNAQVTASGYYPGINAKGGVEITGGTVKAYSEADVAIYSWEDLIISNSIVEAVTGDPDYYSIDAWDIIRIEYSWFSSNYGAFSIEFNNSVQIKDGRMSIYGDAVLPGDVTLPKDYVLVLREGESLTIPEGVTLTNYGTIQLFGGRFINNGSYADYGKTIDDDFNTVNVIEGNGDFPNNWFVTVKSGNGAEAVVYRIVKGEGFTLPEAPQNSGYIFLGWRSGDATYRAGESVDITFDTTFTAVWGNLPDVKPSEPDTPETPVFPFYDVTARDWYYSAVKYVYEKGLMDGVDVGVFAPNDTLTRAMVWTIIARAEGVDTTGGATWYAKAQEWVTAKGISDGENPNEAITRQELVTMLYRLAGEPSVSGTITAPDASSVSTWATNAMTWAMNIGLVEGDENGAVAPTATATRAQAAALIMRYLES